MTADSDRVASALRAYEIGGELGRGGWGVVLAGKHRQLGREVAIKQLPSGLAADPEIRSRFLAEARVLASMDHPHIVPVYDFVEDDGLCLLVMESLPGGTVWSEFQANGLTAERACALAIATCTGLEFAHHTGVLHRDVKPENLMFSAGGVLKLTDFGIAKVLGGAKTVATMAGAIMGTPAYMAPEQATGEDLGPATDVYATGTMLYEFLSGRLPYSDEGGPIALVYRHIHEPPIPLTSVAPALPPVIADVVMRAIARSTAERHATAVELAADLADACTAAWGPGWMSGRSGVSVLGSASVVAITERATDRISPLPSALITPGSPAGAAAANAPVSTAPGTIAPDPLAGAGAWTPGGPPAQDTNREDATILAADSPFAPAPSVPEDATATQPTAEALAASTATVRPVTARHTSASAMDVSAEELVPIEEVLDTGPPSWPVALAALVIAAIAVTIALLGLGPIHHDGASTGVQVNGQDPGAQRVVLDLTKPVSVTFPGRSTPGDVTLKIKVGGVPFASADVARNSRADLESARYLIAGDATLTVTAPDSTKSYSFPIRSAQQRWLTAPAVVGLLATLFVGAYIESLLRSLRRSRRRPTALVGLFVVGGLGGAVVVFDTWVAARTEPTVSTVAVAAALGALAGVAAGWAARRAARRSRMRRYAEAKARRAREGSRSTLSGQS